MKSDETLMKEYREGNEESFGVLYERYASMVYGYVSKKMRESEVDDVYQKVWRNLHEKRHRFESQPFAPWFFVMIKNLMIDEYRSLGRRNKMISPEELRESSSEDQHLEELNDLLSQLPPDVRDLVKKHYLEGVDYDELSKDSGLSESNLRQRLSRALKTLRKIYE